MFQMANNRDIIFEFFTSFQDGDARIAYDSYVFNLTEVSSRL